MSLGVPVAPRRGSKRFTALIAATIAVAAGLVLVPQAGAQATVLTTNDSSPSTSYTGSWIYTTTAAGYAFGDAHYTNVVGQTATFSFTGTSITLIGGKNPDHGRADVKVCDAAGANCGATTVVDSYSATPVVRQTLYSATGLAGGAHTLKVTTRSDSSGSGTYTDIDAYIVDDGVASVSGTHYIDNGAGCSNAGAGTTTATPWCDFTPVQNKALAPGAQLLLARGRTWTQPLKLTGSGTSGNWITLGAYGSGANPVIQGSGAASDRTIVLQNPDYWHIQDLELRNAGMGLLIEYTTLSHNGLDIHGLNAHDLTGIFDVSPKQTDYPDLQNSAAITISAAGAPVTTAGQVVVNGVSIRNNLVHNAAGVYLVADPLVTGTPSHATSTFSGVDITDNNFSRNNAPIIAIESALNPVFEGNWVDCVGHQYEPQGTTCFFLSMVEGGVIQNNILMNMPNNSAPDQTAIDFEYRVKNNVVRGNTFLNNSGAAIEFLQLGRPGDFSTGNVVEQNVFYNNGAAGQLGHISAYTPSATGMTLTVQKNSYQVSPNGFIHTVGSPTITQSDNTSASSEYLATWHFSGTQGANSWRTQSYSGTGSWTDMPTYTASPSRWTAGGGSAVDAFSLFPGVGSSQWVARTWIAPSTGNVRIHGQVSQYGSGPALSVLIERNGAVVWPSVGGTYASVAAGSRTGLSTDTSLAVAAGDVIRFVVYAGGASGASASWTPSISYY